MAEARCPPPRRRTIADRVEASSEGSEAGEGDLEEDARLSELREGDFRAALDFVGEVHDAQGREEFRAIPLPGYRTLVPALHVSYNEIEDGDRVTAAMVEPELPGWAVPARERHAGENPLLRRYLRTRDGRALRFSDVLARRELRDLPIYRHFYAPIGVEHQIAFILPSTPPLTIGVALTRTERDFSERDRRLLELTWPHMIQAYRAAELREAFGPGARHRLLLPRSSSAPSPSFPVEEGAPPGSHTPLYITASPLGICKGWFSGEDSTQGGGGSVRWS